MESKRIIETIGSVIKEELLSSLESHIYPNTCVVEALEPFAGYYGEHPEAITPKHIFLVLRDKILLEELIHVTQLIKKNFDVNFDACLAEISLLNSTCQAIRIKDIESYDKIREIQEHYIFEGVKMKSKKRNIKDKGVIKIEKSFLLEEISDGVYLDKTEPKISYFKIPRRINWKLFEEYTRIVKSNWVNIGFDAALATFIRLHGLEDVIRIYTKDSSEKYLSDLRNLYLKIIIEKYSM